MMEWLNSILTYSSIILLISVLISSISDRWDYRVKMFYIYLWFFLSGIPVIFYGLYVRNPMKTCLCYIYLFEPVSYFLKLKWKVVGQENIDRNKSYVVLCNHQSVLDAVGAAIVWPLFKKIKMVAKKSLKYAGTFGLAQTLCGTVWVDRSSAKGRKAINDAGKHSKETGTSLFLFPEGTRHRGGHGELLDFKKGAFHVALDAKMAILPIVISEYDNILGPPKKEKFQGGEITIKILPAIETEDYSKDDIDELIKKTRDNMISALKSPNQ